MPGPAPDGANDGAADGVDEGGDPAGRPRVVPGAPPRALRVLVTGAALLVAAACAWLAFWVLLKIPLLTVTVAVALLLTALLGPVARWACRRGAPPGVAAALTVVVLLGALLGVGFLVGFRAAGLLRDLTRPLTAGLDRIRVWLVEGPLGLDAQEVTEVRNTVVSGVLALSPEPMAAARVVLDGLVAMVLVAVLLFFLLKDGAGMWSWMLRTVPRRRRAQVDGAGRCAWATLSHYVRGVVIVALIDAVGIGAALLLLGVPLWPSLTLLTFIGAFIPLFGATVSGAIAVLVTLVTNGFGDAVVVLVAVLVVQQVEGNVLHPIIVGRSLRLHPAVVLLAVTAGTLLWGLAGALLAVPLVAVTYRVADHLRRHPGPAPAEVAAPTAVAPAPETPSASAPALDAERTAAR